MYLGAHIGIAEGLPEAVAQGLAIGCEAIQIFSKSPQMWKGPAIPPTAADAFRQAVKDSGLRATAVHHSYLPNLANPDPAKLQASRLAFIDELQRAELLGVDALIIHPGAHMSSGVQAGVPRIAESLNEAFRQTPGVKVRTLLENAAGQGTTLCSTFEQLRDVLAGVQERERVGVALDTCHLFAAGIDFRSEEAYQRLIGTIEATVGLGEIRAFHLNDAKAELGSHLDRHENIGRGQIGLEGFRPLVTDPRWATVPGYLETPMDDRGYRCYAEDLARLRGLLGERRPARATAPGVPPRRRRARAGRKAR